MVGALRWKQKWHCQRCIAPCYVVFAPNTSRALNVQKPSMLHGTAGRSGPPLTAAVAGCSGKMHLRPERTNSKHRCDSAPPLNAGSGSPLSPLHVSTEMEYSLPVGSGQVQRRSQAPRPLRDVSCRGTVPADTGFVLDRPLPTFQAGIPEFLVLRVRKEGKAQTE